MTNFSFSDINIDKVDYKKQNLHKSIQNCWTYRFVVFSAKIYEVGESYEQKHVSYEQGRSGHFCRIPV